ncbi:MAG: hypothetical protein IMF07_01000 [Proteobacteria bacterium]|nr:hypothetical protein [Pseudomonadota bacterium]
MFGFLGKPAEMGLAIVASGIALVFADIERFKRVKGAGFEAEMHEQLVAVIEKQTELPPATDEETNSPLLASVDNATKVVMNALEHPEYTWRYFSGIKKDSKLLEEKVFEVLHWLVENGFARRSHGKHGPIWTLTEEGRHLNIVCDFEDLTAK